MLQCSENHREQIVDPQPLTNAEFDKLAEILQRVGDAMNLETLDGFFAALICGPDNVLPSEYLPEIWGADNEPVFETKLILHEFISLVTRHWNATCHTLQSSDVYLPLLLDDENGVAHGNDWANGFMRGMGMRRDAWAVLMDDEEHAGSLIPIFALAHEHNPDPEMRPYNEPISAEMREKLIVGAAAAVAKIYAYFEAERTLGARQSGTVTNFRRDAAKVGRNEPCPCGSGKKFKHCCARATLH